MTYCIAFHSYKGGTGKTTIASNLSAHLANQGKKVVLIDLDVYSPSLQTYFKINPNKCINDYLYSSNVDVKDILTNMSTAIQSINENDETNQIMNTKDISSKENKNVNLGDKFYVCFSRSTLSNMQMLDVSGLEDQRHYFRKLLLFRDSIIKSLKPDYIIIDTSPGIRFWSLNALAISDIFLLTLKSGDIDIKGTQSMIKEIYNSFISTGTKSFLLMNKVAGYCSPNINITNSQISINSIKNKTDLIEFQEEFGINELLNSSEINVISSIPCYCDIQFKEREFLTSILYPIHPFSQKIKLLAKKMDEELCIA